MQWIVEFYEDFQAEFNELDNEVQDELLAVATRLEARGPVLNRPHVDTLKGSNYSNMKELRFNANDGVWRVAFAFDSRRRAILLVAGDKSGISQDFFYNQLIKTADKRFRCHLSNLEKELCNGNNFEGDAGKSTSGKSRKNSGKSKRA